MAYPHELIGWLYDVLNSLDWKLGPLEILETERTYPGLMSDLSTESWVRRMIRQQLEGSGKEPETEDE